MQIPINVTLKQIYEVCCPECRQKVLDLAGSDSAKQAIKDALKLQLEQKEE